MNNELSCQHGMDLHFLVEREISLRIEVVNEQTVRVE